MANQAAFTLDQKQLPEAIARAISAKKVVLLRGDPGLGKSQIIHQVAEKHNLKMIDIRLAQCDPTDLQGFPTQNGVHMDYLPPVMIPLESDPIPEGYDGWLLFLDEYVTAPPSVQAASYKVILDRKIGQYNIHPRVAMVAAGNEDSNKAITFRLSTAAQSRFVHHHLTCSYVAWLEWAAENGIDHRIRAYIKWRPDNLHKFNPDHKDDTFPCPRTWEYVHDLIHKRKELDHIDLGNIIGSVGPGVGREFRAFTKIYESGRLPTFEEIVENPEGINIPDKPDVIHAITSIISHPENIDRMPDALPFIERLPIEHQVWCLRDVIRQKSELLNDPKLNEWKQRNAKRML